MDNIKKNAIIITLVISTAFTLTACGDKPSSNSSFSDNDSSYSASADINSSIADDSSLSEQTTVTTSTTQSDSKQPSVNPQVTSPKAPTKSQVATTKVQAGITPPPTTTQVTKKLIVPTAAQCQVIENEITRLVNQYRASKGLHTLTAESKLMQAARIRSSEASTPGNFGHIRPDGRRWSTVFTDVKYGTPNTFQEYVNGEWVTKTEYGSGASAENLGATDSEVVNGQNYFECSSSELKAVANHLFNLWKASTDHNKNMLNSNYNHMGIGIYSYLETMTNGEKVVAFYSIQLFTTD